MSGSGKNLSAPVDQVLEKGMEQKYFYTMKKKIHSRLFLVSIVITVLASCLHVEQPEVKRTELQRHDLGTPGREAIQVVISFSPGASFGKHSHPGEEIIYVLEGLIEYKVEGRPPVTLKAGDVLFIPAGTVHEAKNAGGVTAKELATYIVEKNKPLLIKN